MYGQPNRNPAFGQAPPSRPPNLQFQQRPQGPLPPAPPGAPPYMGQGRPPPFHQNFHRGPFFPLPPPPPPPPQPLAATNPGFYFPPPILPSPPLATSSSLDGGEIVNPVPPLERKEANDVQGADSDMEMEDDITSTDKDQKTDTAEDISNMEKFSGKENPTEQQNIIIRHEISSEILNPLQQNKDVALKLDDSLPSNSFSPAGDTVAAETASKNDSKIIKDDSPIRLLQGYASDDSLENDKNDLLRNDISPSRKAADNSPTSLVEGKDCIGESTSIFSAKIADRSQENIDEDSQSYSIKKSTDDEGARDFSRTRKSLEENEEKKSKPDSASLKLDEFGRLIREGLSDSGSDHPNSNRRVRRTKRDRSHSRSRSPLDRRRTRDSRRRKDKRSRSRSWSPRNRSRSRSPSHRRAGEFSNEKIRSNRSRGQDCFDFTRGKCFRGASCKYMHHEVGKSDGSRRYDNKHKNPEASSGKENHTTKTERRSFSSKFSDDVYDKTRAQEIQYEGIDRKKKDIVADATLDKVGDLVDFGMVNCPSPIGDMKITQEKLSVPNLQNPDHGSFQKSHEPPSFDNVASVLHRKSNTSDAGDRNPDCKSNQLHDSPLSDALPNQTTSNSPKEVSDSRSAPISSKPPPSFPLPSSANAFSSKPPPSFLLPGLPPAPPFPLPSSANAPPLPQLPINYPSMAQIPPFPLQSAHTYSHKHQNTQFFAPPNSSWILPPPPPRPLPYEISASSQFQPSHFHQRNDYVSQIFVRPNPESISRPPSNYGPQNFVRPNSESISSAPVTGFPPRNDYGPQIFVRPTSENAPVSVFQPQKPHPSVHEPHQPNSQLENSSSENLRIQLNTPDVSRQNHAPHPESFGSRTSPPSNQPSHSSSEVHPLLHTASGNLQYHEGDKKGRLPENSGFQDINQASMDPDFGVPRITAHHNPYASTFEKPLGSKSSYNPANNQYEIPFNSRRVSIDEQGFGSYGAKNTISSPGSDSKILTSGGGSQYDPLLDSIEPTNARKKDHFDQKLVEHAEKDLSVSHELENLIENNKHEIAAVASTSLDNDEIDAEAGAVDNESLSDHGGTDNSGDLVKTEKTKKTKSKKDSSRSTKPFKMAIAKFVKDVLKPSWRQGNMSKEAFKTIVKKTVDKVSGAMKGHNLPKSRAKIDQYIDSSQRKLTKLVMGYVDKYVKV